MPAITFEDKVALRDSLLPRKNSVTADDINEIKAAVNELYDNPVSGQNIGNTDLTIDDAVRTLDIDGNKFKIINGKIIFGDDLSLPYLLSVNGAGESISAIFAVASGLVAVFGSDATGRGVVGSTTSGVGVDAVATGSGVALRAARSSGLAGQFIGKALIEPTNTLVNSDSAIFEVNSTTLGSLPAPRVTSTEKNAIPAPATSLLVFDTTRNRYEFYNGSYWQGVATRYLQVMHGSFGPTNGQTVAFGQAINAPTVATNAYFEITMRGNGVIRGCDLNMLVGGTPGTTENWSLYVRHNGTDYLVETVGSNAVVRKFSNTSMNIPYVDGDIVRMIYVNPTWGTPPTSVTAAGSLILQ